MPFPLNPRHDAPAVEPGPPAPLLDPELAEPDAAAVAAAPQAEELEALDPTAEDEAMPLDVPVVLGSDGRTVTALAYLSEADATGVRVHLMATADGEHPVDRSDLSLELRIPGAEPAALALPAGSLEPGLAWEADLVFPLDGSGLAPGASTLALTLSSHPPIHCRI